MRVLLVDDEPSIRFVVRKALEGSGFEAASAQSGSEALTLLERDVRCDAIVMDLIMPDMKGKDFLEVVRQRPDVAHIPVVIITGAEPSVAIFPPKESYQALLKKPFKLARLVDTVTELLGEPFCLFPSPARPSVGDPGRKGYARTRK